jgi:hypothetical protein
MESPSEPPTTFTSLVDAGKGGTIIVAPVFKKLSRFEFNLRKQALTTAGKKFIDLTSIDTVKGVNIVGISLEECFHVVSQSYNDLNGRRGCVLTMVHRGKFEVITGLTVERQGRWMEIGRLGEKYHTKWREQPERRFY